MLAQLNSKQKSTFFNIKPTVIDKLISKNKTSIQNNLLYTNEESDESVSDDSDESSSSGQESNIVAPEPQALTMAPNKKGIKVGVLGSKLTRSQIPLKRGRGRPPKLIKGHTSIKAMALKQLLENSKRGFPKKAVKDTVKINKKVSVASHSEKIKHSRTPVKKESLPTLKASSPVSISDTVQPLTTKKNTRVLKEQKPVTPVKVKSPSKSSPNLQLSSVSSTDSNSSPRKFPSNIVDRWKSTGMVIRGRGRGTRGSFRGPFKAGMARSGSRAERYITRDSQTTGLMRSGKRRKCSDSKLVEGLESDRKIRKVTNKGKTDKSGYISDEQSSFVTTSELSFCDNDNSLKQSDDEVVISGSLKIKVEDVETDNSRDTNSNVFKKGKKQKLATASSSATETKNQSNNIETITSSTNTEMMKPKKSWARGRKRQVDLSRNVATPSESSIRDSDCSFDSDLTEDSSTPTKSGFKKHRRRGIDGSWVRRSTRSVNKSVDNAESEDVVIHDLLKEKDLNIDVDSNSISSLDIISETICDPPKQSMNDVIVIAEKQSNKLPEKESKIETSIKETFSDSTLLVDSIKSTLLVDSIKNKIATNNLVESQSDFDVKNNTSSCSFSNVGENDSLSDFSLALDETPIKKLVASEPEIKSELSFKLNFDFSSDNCIEESKTSKEFDILVSDSDNEQISTIGSNKHVSLDENECNSLPISAPPALQKTKIIITKEKKCELVFSDNKEESKSHNDNNNSCAAPPRKSVEGNLVDESNDKECNNDIITDEKIISLIDSFCQSNSLDGKVQELSNVENDNNKITLDSVNESKVESNVLDKGPHESVSTTGSIGPKGVAFNISPDSLQNFTTSDTSKENDLACELLKIKELFDGIKSKHLNVEKAEESIQDFDSLKLHTDVNNSDQDSYKDNLKMEIDLDSADKVVESTEESSSSDSNSHLLELMKTPLNCDLISNTIKIPNVNNSDMTNLLPMGEGDVCSKSEIDSYTSCLELNSNTEAALTQSERMDKPSIEESMKEMPSKELLSALGLQSLHSSGEEEKPKRPTDSYTGTLKAVIKLNRSSDKKSGGRQMIFKQSDMLMEDPGGGGDRLEYRICSAQGPLTENVPLTHLGDIPANRKAVQLKVKSHFDLSNSPNIMGVGASAETAATDATKEGGKQNLVIPEKSSSFSIHPERLCTDFCCYCLGKFGSLDTPCHLAQLKNSDRQSKILANEKHLSVDSCLCDGCFRFIDRKVNCPSSQRPRKPTARRGPLAGTICAVQDCSQAARHSVRRKWLIKLKKSIGKKLVIDMDKNPQLPVPLCSQHYYWVDYFTVCGICKKRLTRNHMYALGPEANELNKALSDDGIPVRLSDNLFLCKLCRYFSNLRLKCQDPAAKPSSNGRDFLNQYRKQILRYHDIPVSESEEEGKSVEEGIASEVSKAKKKKSKSKSFYDGEFNKNNAEKDDKSDAGVEDRSSDSQMIDYSYLDALNVHREDSTVPMGDYSDLRDFEGQVGFSNIASLLNPMEGGQGAAYPTDSQNRSRTDKPTRIQVKFGNLNIGKLSNLNIGQDSRPASSTTPVLERPPFMPGERDMNLVGDYEFHGPLNPSSGWERCTYNIQFDRDTKKLWQDLQRPYGNQSSFLRHLVILEKHWRNGSLVFSENPNPKAVKYFTSVQNRVQAYDGAKSSDIGIEKPKQAEATVETPPSQRAPTPLKVISVPPPLMKIAPGSLCWRPNQVKKPPPYNFPITSTQTSATQSFSAPGSAPPPYRFHNVQPNHLGYRTVKIPFPPVSGAFQPSSSPQVNKGQNNPRPSSLSYQQFKKIRLEPQPPTVVGKVTVVPKVEQIPESQTTSTATTNFSENFAPLICDVRSLASSTSEIDWSDSFRKQQQKLLKQNVAKYYAPILPKIPSSLTVTSFPQTSALVMKTKSLTIEKAPISHSSSKHNIVPPEKPSISVFREPTAGESG